MIKVLIVDDEPKLREGLRALIPWEELGYTVVATAANGLQALEKYHTCHPELIVADIRMPGMDGLELIAELREQGSNCHVLILSGYADFEYAKRAIAHRIDGYLLKPVDEEEMVSYLIELRDTIAQEGRFSRWNEEEPARNREMLLRALLQPASAEEGEDDPAKHVAALGLKPGHVEVVLLELLAPSGSGEEDERAVKAAVEQHFGSSGERLFFTLPPYIGLLLQEPLQGEQERGQLMEELSGLIRRKGYDFSAATGGTVPGPEEAALSFQVARELLRRAFFFRKGILISADLSGMLFAGVLEERAEEGQDAESRLLLAVETGNRAAIEPLVKVICADLLASGSEEQRIKDTFVRILSTVLARLEPVYPEIRSNAAKHSPPIGELYQSHYLADLQEQVVNFLAEIADQMSSGGKGNEIKKITELIHRRYNENLKLETLSELFSYNSAYLGKMFKNTTGEYFNTYVDKVRIEKAKEFLAQGMKVYEVAEKVGYMNPDYFNAKFRKYVGTSPSSFRKNN
ncbi:response regulator transcription factor [Paenibacillus albidus]|uniref:response regulator transcription factor n=1 Tax=Paenibacillus albidus TaxID=2041023 RepID=UPI001BE5F5D6|nr:response regulator transcription factor [Paenibacillus albidus]MBT2291050.1 response regulator transcription factor [Paenibacillus albidus]